MNTLFLISLVVAVCSAVEDVSNVRQDFKTSTIHALNEQIVKELQASYIYKAYSQYYARADVSLPGFAKFFSKAAKEESEHAEKLMDYLNMRGGEVKLQDIKLNDVCDVVSEELGKHSGIENSRTKACMCYFMAKSQTWNLCGDRDEWYNGLMGMEDALVLERFVNQKLLDLHKATESDAHLSHVLEHDFLDEQVQSIKSIGDTVKQLRRVKKGLGEYLLDGKM
ncbi:yolk ferritin-like [Mytilus galloprovincialis]|uniref:Ferritin n=1 Tax=Mytilus edulis TaxID=6550 RepID=A0A8S3RBE3_MYTED|nr:FTH1 [Mytilus edulis]